MRREEGGWEYAPMAAAMEDAGSEEIGVYILKSQKMVALFIVVQQILDLLDRLVRMPVAWFSLRWWKQEGINLTGVREGVAEVAGREEERGVEEEAQEETTRRSWS